MEIRPITAQDARIVRWPVLRAGLPAETAILERDDDPETRHFGAYDGGRLVGVATFFPEKCPVEPRPRAWCLRGMATLPDLQRRGAGRALVAEGVGAAEAAGAELMWCKARTSARGFYESLGFVALGEEFHIPITGPHFLMTKRLEPRA